MNYLSGGAEASDRARSKLLSTDRESGWPAAWAASAARSRQDQRHAIHSRDGPLPIVGHLLPIGCLAERGRRLSHSGERGRLRN